MSLGLRALLSQINLRHAHERKLRTTLTVVGLAAGVALVISISLINTTLSSSIRATARAMGGAAEIEVAGADRTGLPSAAIERVTSVEGVDQAVPVLRSFTRARGPDGSVRLMVLGVTPDFPALFPEGAGGTESVELHGDLGFGRGVVLSETAADSLGVSVDDPIWVDTPHGPQSLPVTGTVSGDLLLFFNGGNVGTMLLPTAQATFERPDRVDSIYVIVDEQSDLEDTESSIRDALENGAIVGPPGTRAGGFEDSLNGISALTSVAGTVALFVAAFVVYNTMSMSLAERRREISMALALGATRGQVLAAFIAEAVLLGLIAAALGIGLGIGLASVLVGPALESLRIFDINASSPLVVPWVNVALGALSGIGVAILGTLLPARRIMKLAPVESLRPQGVYEWVTAPASKRNKIIRNVVGTAMLVGGVVFLSLDPSSLDNITLLTNLGLVFAMTGATLVLPTFVLAGVEALRPLVGRATGAPGRVAVDALRKNPARTTVTAGALVFTLGISVGVASALASFESQWAKSAGLWWAAPLYVESESHETLGSDQPLPARAARSFEHVQGVAGVYPERYRVVNVAGRQTVIYVVPLSLHLADDAELSPEGKEWRADLADDLPQGEIVISRNMAKANDLAPGDEIEIPTPTGDRSFVVGDTIEDLNSLDSFYMDSSSFLRFWKDPKVDRFEITLEPGADQKDVIAGLRNEIRDDGFSAEVVTRSQLIAGEFESIEELFSVAKGIQAAALVVAALAIANTMFIAVFERRWELGLQRAIGMSRLQMVASLLLEAGVIGLVGGVGAALLGAGMGYMMLEGMSAAYTFTIPFRPSSELIVLSLAVGTVIAALAGVYPTRSAARVPIIESLRYE